MGDMLIRGIPEALKTDIEQAAKSSGQSLSTKAIELLRKGMVADKEAQTSDKSAWDEIRSVFVEHDGIGEEFSKIMDEIEAERKRDFGTPPDWS